MFRSLCGVTGAEAIVSEDEGGGARIVNFEVSCCADAFFLGAARKGYDMPHNRKRGEHESDMVQKKNFSMIHSRQEPQGMIDVSYQCW